MAGFRRAGHKFGVIEFLNGLHTCAKFHENQKGSRFFVDLAWNDPCVCTSTSAIKEVASTKYLGVLIDNKLTLNDHNSIAHKYINGFYIVT